MTKGFKLFKTYRTIFGTDVTVIGYSENHIFYMDSRNVRRSIHCENFQYSSQGVPMEIFVGNDYSFEKISLEECIYELNRLNIKCISDGNFELKVTLVGAIGHLKDYKKILDEGSLEENDV